MKFPHIKSLGIMFIFGFFLNYIWEHLHAPLYISGYSGSISEWDILLSTLLDAAFILLFGIIIFTVPFFKNKMWLSIPICVIGSIVAEHIGISLEWWVYGPKMPIIPLLGTGITPTIQIGIIAYITYKIVLIFQKKEY